MLSSKEQQGERKKAFLREQCNKQRKTIEWERREISSRKLEITREHFTQIGHNNVQKWYGSTRSRRHSDEVEAYKELYKKGLNDLDNQDGVITHRESEILECEVKWALGNITMNKVSGGDELS